MSKYPGKILLFGEYTILQGGYAVAVPSSHYIGQWTSASQLNPEVDAFLNFIKASNFPFLHPIEDIEFTHFECNIPIGYGLGSSGVITAGVYDLLKKDTPKDLDQLKDQLAQMESFFHGRSSGFDPLVSLIQKAISMSDGKINVLQESLDLSKTWLINSNAARSTSDMVSVFNKKMEEDRFQQFFDAQWKRLVNEQVTYLLEERRLNFDLWKQLSALQLEHLDEFILDSIRSIWEKGMEHDYYLKLCGAGGGGMYLCHGNYDNFKKHHPKVETIPV